MIDRSRTWTMLAALGLVLAPAAVFAAPPEGETARDVFAPVDIVAPEPAPAPEPEVEPEPEPEPEPAPEPPPPVLETVLADDPHATGDEHHGIEQPRPKIPPTGNTQMWFRSTTFFDYFGNNYDPLTNNDQFYALVNYVNFGSDTRFKKTWQLSTMIRVDTHNVFNGKAQPLCDTDNSYPLQIRETIPDPNNPGQRIPNPDYDPDIEANPDLAVRDTEAAQCNYGSDYRIERFQLRFGNKYFEFTGGDFNVNFSQGIGLAVRKIADIGVDATVKGARADVKTKYIDLTGIAGLANRQQTDFATRQLFRDPGYPHALCEMTPELAQNKYGNRLWTMCSDIIAGGRADAKLPGKVTVGGHYVFIFFGQRADAVQYDGMHLVGGDITRKRIAKHWDVFAAVTGLLRNPQHKQYWPDYVENGIAAYLSNSLTFGSTFVLLEGKYYDNYVVAKDVSATTVQYSQAPTLERADQIIPAASNTAGGRILVEHTLPNRLTLVFNYLGYAYALQNDEDMFDPNVGEMAHHGYVGLRWRNLEKGSEIQAFGGYRWEGFQRPRDGWERPYTRKLPHGEFYINKQIGKTGNLAHSLSLRWEWRYERVHKGAAPPKYFHRGNLILGYGMSPWLTIAFIGGYSSEFPPLDGQLHPQPGETDKPHLWPGGEVRFNFLESSFLRVFVGRQVGGLLCVNGSCRLLPDFEGARMDLVLSF